MTVITTFAFRRRFVKVTRDDPWLGYTIAHWVDGYSCMVFKGSRLTKNTRAVTKGKWSDVIGVIALARTYVARRIVELREFFVMW